MADTIKLKIPNGQPPSDIDCAIAGKILAGREWFWPSGGALTIYHDDGSETTAAPGQTISRDDAGRILVK